jgi:hypothetical protein
MPPFFFLKKKLSDVHTSHVTVAAPVSSQVEQLPPKCRAVGFGFSRAKSDSGGISCEPQDFAEDLDYITENTECSNTPASVDVEARSKFPPYMAPATYNGCAGGSRRGFTYSQAQRSVAYFKSSDFANSIAANAQPLLVGSANRILQYTQSPSSGDIPVENLFPSSFFTPSVNVTLPTDRFMEVPLTAVLTNARASRVQDVFVSAQIGLVSGTLSSKCSGLFPGRSGLEVDNLTSLQERWRVAYPEVGVNFGSLKASGDSLSVSYDIVLYGASFTERKPWAYLVSFIILKLVHIARLFSLSYDFFFFSCCSTILGTCELWRQNPTTKLVLVLLFLVTQISHLPQSTYQHSSPSSPSLMVY